MEKKNANYVTQIRIALSLIALYKLQFYVDTAKKFEVRFTSSDYELDRSLPKGRNRKVIGSRKNDLGGKIMNNFAALRAKTYSYLTYNNHEDKN